MIGLLIRLLKSQIPNPPLLAILIAVCLDIDHSAETNQQKLPKSSASGKSCCRSGQKNDAIAIIGKRAPENRDQNFNRY